jgi:hypothetical protein
MNSCDYRAIVATNRFDEAGNATFLQKRMAGRPVQLPGNRDYWPDKTHMAWHRENTFVDSSIITIKDTWAKIEKKGS